MGMFDNVKCLAEHLGIETPVTPVGQQQETILMQGLQSLTPGPEKVE